jgi:UPF0271 protein
MVSIDLNCDLGESSHLYEPGNDAEVLQYITSANIACGYHAGNHNIMMDTVRLAKETGVAVGAHPSFPDLEGFGRNEMKLSLEEIFNMIIYQIGAFEAVVKANGMKVNHVKPHGALYNIASRDYQIAQTVANAIHTVNPNFILFALSGSQLAKAGQDTGLNVAHEVFADRTYQLDGSLTSRTEANAMIANADLAVERVIRMVKEEKVTCVNGEDIGIKADTVCLHGDEPEALLFAQRLIEGFRAENIEVRSFGVEQDV